MICADALDCENPVLLEHTGSFRDSQGICSRIQVVMRSAHRTGDRLSVEAAIGGVMVLGGAERVQRPRFHRGVRTIIGNTFNYRVARAAVGAVDVWIEVARIAGIEKLGQAFLADWQIGRNAHGWMAVSLTLANCEPSYASRFRREDVDGGDVRCGWRLCRELMKECIER